ncbi:MAG: SDR family NAD(P)-dependent oxidoreductase, partial [Alphaproteobacteria bacterium]|nr:SDR family NAD(P)-dependent oxidoreductase [Alphaproteobacteria bacterium]
MVDLVNELEGKVAIVTGSARNIGRATAEELARAGASVVINALSRKDLCEEVAEGINASGGRAIAVMADCR